MQSDLPADAFRLASPLAVFALHPLFPTMSGPRSTLADLLEERDEIVRELGRIDGTVNPKGAVELRRTLLRQYMAVNDRIADMEGEQT